MAVTLEQFVKQLEESGILAGDTLKDFVPPKASPKDVEGLARELIRRKKLTKFQAEEVYRGKAKSLVLGNYVLLDKIGAGGMGQVFKARHRRMDRIVAVKLLPSKMTKDKAAIARFEREAKAAAKLRHPNIVAADDADQANGVHFLVMEFVEGSDLSALVKKNGPLPVERAVNYILQAAKGLEFAHKKGVVHRDIKPANLLLDTEGTVKILDMGLARIEQGDGPAQVELTGAGAVMGTVDYMAPEQAMQTKAADARADIYSLGCSLFYLLSGKAIYDGDTLTAILLAHQQQPIPRLKEVQANAPKQLETVFSKMVAKKVEDRYQAMSEVVAALEAVASGGLGNSAAKGETTACALSAEETNTLGDAGGPSTTRTLSSLTEVVASEKTKHLLAKIIGGSFATIIAPILVTLVLKRMDDDAPPPNPPAPSATVAPTSQNAPLAANANAATPAKVVTRPNMRDVQQWMNDVAALPAEKQVEAVAQRLRELNPHFIGKVTPKIENGVVTELRFVANRIHNISPVRALTGLRVLRCSPGKAYGKSKLSDLSPLAGLPLAELDCSSTEVSDLSPLENCKSLQTLFARNTNVTPAGVAALKKALPKCKIEWDEPATR